MRVGGRLQQRQGAPKGKKVNFKVNRREERPFSVDVFQQTQGRKVIGNRLVARFKNKTKTFTWNGKDRKGRRSRRATTSSASG